MRLMVRALLIRGLVGNIMPQWWRRREGTRQRDEIADRKVLGAGGGIEPGRREQGRDLDAERAQALAQHFASLAECRLSRALQQPTLARERLGSRHQAYE